MVKWQIKGKGRGKEKDIGLGELKNTKKEYYPHTP